MKLYLEKKKFFFKFPVGIRNANKIFNYKKGWIIRISNDKSNYGFGEINPLEKNDLELCKTQLNKIPRENYERKLIENIDNFHPCIQSSINSAISELHGNLIFKDTYHFNKIHETAILLNSDNILSKLKELKENLCLKDKIVTIKWKVALQNNKYEENILEKILCSITSNLKLRIDSNGSWERKTAERWAEILKDSNCLDWLEQPLACDDLEGLINLSKKIPVALDESLIKYPSLIKEWDGWQIRRPSQEKNPMLLLNELNNKKGFRSISSSFETGIGTRLLYHFANIQLLGPTPKVPGLALNQVPKSNIFSNKPDLIWEIL